MLNVWTLALTEALYTKSWMLSSCLYRNVLSRKLWPVIQTFESVAAKRAIAMKSGYLDAKPVETVRALRKQVRSSQVLHWPCFTSDSAAREPDASFRAPILFLKPHHTDCIAYAEECKTVFLLCGLQFHKVTTTADASYDNVNSWCVQPLPALKLAI